MSENQALLGGVVPAERGEDHAYVISAVEQVTGGDTLLSYSSASINRSGVVGRLSLTKTVRLTPDEREHLIRQLLDHRFADLAASLDDGATS